MDVRDMLKKTWEKALKQSTHSEEQKKTEKLRAKKLLELCDKADAGDKEAQDYINRGWNRMKIEGAGYLDNLTPRRLADICLQGEK